MRALLAITITITIALASVGTASGNTPTLNDVAGMWANATRAGDARSRALHGAALSYWSRVLPGIVTAQCPEGVYGYFADLDDEDAGAWGYGAGCAATLDRSTVTVDFRAPRNTYIRGGRAYTTVAECAMWTHEIGHALGLEHEDKAQFSVMGPFADGADAPRECRQITKRMFPRDFRSLAQNRSLRQW